jgi:Activator of Hsp90 ATPase homolog 1-like protein
MSECVKRELLLPASVQDVWDVVTDHGWLADEVELDLRTGGEVRVRLHDEVRTGWIEDAVVPDEDTRHARLIFWWAIDGEPASRVELTLEAWDELTRLRIVETRPLELLDLVGVPLPGASGPSFGPALIAA